MTNTPHPSTLGEILDRTASLYRAHFLAFLGTAAPPAAVLLGCMGAMVLLFTTAGSKPESALAMGLGVGATFLIGMPIYLGANALCSAALTHASSGVFFEEPISIRGSYRAAWKHGWRYLGVYFLQVLLVAGAPFVAWMLAVMVLAAMAGRSGANPSSAATAMLLLVVIALTAFVVWMLLRVSLAFPATVVEETGPVTALKRAGTLSRGTRGRLLVLYLLGIAVSWIVSVVLLSPMFLLALIPSLNTPAKAHVLGTIVIVIFYGISFSVQALTKPIYAIALVLFYYDQRIRREGFDIELLMRQAGMVIEAAAPAELKPWMPPEGQAPERSRAATASPAKEVSLSAAEDAPQQGTGGLA